MGAHIKLTFTHDEPSGVDNETKAKAAENDLFLFWTYLLLVFTRYLFHDCRARTWRRDKRSG